MNPPDYDPLIGRIIASASPAEAAPVCRRCGAVAIRGHAIPPALVPMGDGNFSEGAHTGPEPLADVWKCPACGHSFTKAEEVAPKPFADAAANLLLRVEQLQGLREQDRETINSLMNKNFEVCIQLDQWQSGPITEEMLRRNSGCIHLGNGCSLVRTKERTEDKDRLNEMAGLAGELAAALTAERLRREATERDLKEARQGWYYETGKLEAMKAQRDDAIKRLEGK